MKNALVIFKLQRLALPLTLAQLAFAANNFVTNLVLAHASQTALHAALPGSMLAVAFSALAISTLGYAGTIFARRHADGDCEGARTVFRAALILSVATIPLFLLAAPLGRMILAIFDTEPDVLAAESAYFDVLLVNGFFTMLAAVLGGYFTGQGRTHFVGFVTVFGFLVNMALAPAFIFGWWNLPVSGIQGAGWAATIAHIVPCLILSITIYLKKGEGENTVVHNTSTISLTRLASAAKDILRLGLPNGIRSVIDIGGFFVFVAVLAECPRAAVAASTAAFAVNGVFLAFPQGLAAALEILTARRARSARGAAILLTAIYVSIFAILLACVGENILTFFHKDNTAFSSTAFQETARILLMILSIKALFESLVMVFQADLRGNGHTTAVFRIQFFSSLLFWMPTYLTVRAWHATIPAYWLTMVFCSLLSTILLARRIAQKSPPFRVFR